MKQYLAVNNVKVLDGWVAGSPDMNTIEAYWGRIQSAVSERGPFGREELEVFVKEEFFSVPMTSVAKHVMSFRRICQDVVKYGGKSVNQ